MIFTLSSWGLKDILFLTLKYLKTVVLIVILKHNSKRPRKNTFFPVPTMKLQFLLPAATFIVGAFAHADCKFFTDPTTHKGTLDLTAFCPKDAKKGDQVGEYRMDMNMCLTATKQGLALGNTYVISRFPVSFFLFLCFYFSFLLFSFFFMADYYWV